MKNYSWSLFSLVWAGLIVYLSFIQPVSVGGVPWFKNQGATIGSSTTDHDGATTHYRFNYTVGWQNSSKTFQNWFIPTRIIKNYKA